MKNIDLMIIGAHKAGTTSLKNYLNEHPEVVGHVQRDMKYFMDENEYDTGYEQAYNNYMNVGNLTNPKIVVAKDAGTYLLKDNLEKIKKHNGDCKIVMIIRNPVKRAYSHYKFEIGKGYYHHLDFNDITNYASHSIGTNDLDEEQKVFGHFLELGKYSFYLENVISLFGDTNVKVIRFEDFKSNPELICQEVFSWLKIDSDFKPNIDKIHNESKKPKSVAYSKFLGKVRSNENVISFLKKMMPSTTYKKVVDWSHNLNSNGEAFEPMTEETMKALTTYYRPYNEKLESLIKIDLSDWK